MFFSSLKIGVPNIHLVSSDVSWGETLPTMKNQRWVFCSAVSIIGIYTGRSSFLFVCLFAFQDFRGKGNKKFSSSAGSAKGSNTTICSVGSSAPSKPAPPPPTSKPPLIAKWKPGAKLLGQSESDGTSFWLTTKLKEIDVMWQLHCTNMFSKFSELYEGLKRAQRSRLEDQRGTEINFELPDFLKVCWFWVLQNMWLTCVILGESTKTWSSDFQDKENAPQSSKKLKKFLQPRRDGTNSAPGNESQSGAGTTDNIRSTSLNHSHGKFDLKSFRNAFFTWND